MTWAEFVLKVKNYLLIQNVSAQTGQTCFVIWVPGRNKGLPAPESEGPSNCLKSIWTPKTWPFYSLCFPCFSPVLFFSFCSASNSLHPSELREGWCVFTFWTQHKTEVDFFGTKKEKSLCTIDIISIVVTHSMFMFPSRMPQSLSECLTVQRVVHVCIFEVAW